MDNDDADEAQDEATLASSLCIGVLDELGRLATTFAMTKEGVVRSPVGVRSESDGPSEAHADPEEATGVRAIDARAMLGRN